MGGKGFRFIWFCEFIRSRVTPSKDTRSERSPFPWVRLGQPAVLLAPMEGVIDAPMRAFLTEAVGVGALDFCVTEFVRVTQDVPPEWVLKREIPELLSRGVTAAGVPVVVQFLGGDPLLLAESARIAVETGALAIDLNFGCPSPTVNQHDGGATLLKFPKRIREIVSAVRQAVPKEIPVSAKLRLGWDRADAIHENARMAAEGGADWLTIHGRTKVQGYAPPAAWEPIGEVRAALPIPVVANGDIYTLDDLKRCRDVTGCEHFMIGRGILSDLSLAAAIAGELKGQTVEPRFLATLSAEKWREATARFVEISLELSGNEGYTLSRLKQWINMANRKSPIPWFDRFKRTQNLADAMQVIREAGSAPATPL